MKKTLLLTSLVASMVAMAGTTGSVEAYNENEATFVKGVKPTFVAKKTGVKTEVKVEGTGFSFGGEFKAEDLELGNVTKANYLNHSSVWAKYELPEIKGVKSYVKASVSPKFVEGPTTYYVVHERDAEAEVNKLIDGLTNKDAKAKLIEEAKKEGYNFAAGLIEKSKSEKKEVLKTILVEAIKSTIRKNRPAEEARIAKMNATPKNVDKGSAELEGQISYKHDMLTFGFNSKTNFPLSNKTYAYLNGSHTATYDVAADYGAIVKSTHKVFVESEEGKDVFVKGLKDVKANVEVKHDYAKTVTKAGDRVDYVSGEASAKYDGVKDLELEGKVAFKKNVSGEKIGDYEVLGTKLFKEVPARYIHSYELKGTYKGVKHLTLSAKPFVAHVNIAKEVTSDNKVKRDDYVAYGVELNAEYKMLNDKLTLTGKSLLAGLHDRMFDGTKANTGVFVFDANAKYDYSVTGKFTVSPEANANLELKVAKKADKLVTVPSLTLTPKVSAEYKPTDTLTLKGSVETPVKFKVVGKEFKYTDTQVKTSLNLKYEWK
ncbi:hypothetical protein [uncultured Sneathia sp.]|uniref:hypothetical protein n=1 Tax=uncultured Sneathia sp. TaxID=278067 RepID=UPI002804771A|nr:hypothetical protein [uncultured Sneathia sp.]